jgi:hypothetical protein
VWARPLVGGEAALAMINFAYVPATVTCDPECLATVFSRAGSEPIRVRARDLVAGKPLAQGEPLGQISATLPAEGGSALFRLSTVH